MRVLRFGTSEDREGDIPEEQRGYRLAERMLADAAGEPVETIATTAWPSAGFPERFQQLVEEHRPDLVFLKINWFWYGYESVPLKFERRFGRAGKTLGRAGVRVGASPMFANSRVFQTFRRLLTRAIGGGATYFTPQQVVECMGDCIRRAVTHEDTVLVVRGPGGWGHAPLMSRAAWRRENARREYIDAHLTAACEHHHVYLMKRFISKEELEERLTPAWFRSSPAGHDHMGREEGEAMIAAWRHAHALAR